MHKLLVIKELVSTKCVLQEECNCKCVSAATNSNKSSRTSIDIAHALGKIMTKFMSRTPCYLSACSNITQHIILTKSMEYLM